MGRLTGPEPRCADKRLLDLLGEDVLLAVHRELAHASDSSPKAASTATAAETGTHFEPRGAGVRWLARLKRWQSSLFLAALGCGAAVSIIGVIDLISQLRLVVSGVGAVAVVVTVFLQTRHQRSDEGWIGS